MAKASLYKFDILSVILTILHNFRHWFEQRPNMHIACIRSSISALDSCLEFLFLYIQNSKSVLIDKTAKGLFYTCLTLNFIYVVTIVAYLYRLHGILEQKINQTPDVEKIKNNQAKYDSILGKRVTFLYKAVGFPITVILAAFAGYLWKFYNESLMVFIIVSIDACLELLEFLYMFGYFLFKSSKTGTADLGPVIPLKKRMSDTKHMGFMKPILPPITTPNNAVEVYVMKDIKYEPNPPKVTPYTEDYDFTEKRPKRKPTPPKGIPYTEEDSDFTEKSQRRKPNTPKGILYTKEDSYFIVKRQRRKLNPPKVIPYTEDSEFNEKRQRKKPNLPKVTPYIDDYELTDKRQKKKKRRSNTRLYDHVS